jgi:hypothetical protein
MNKATLDVEAPLLLNLLTDLAGEIDGLADLGITVCFIQEEEMAGRHSYLVQRCEQIRLIVNSLVSTMNGISSLQSKEPGSLQSELLAATDLLLNAFGSLERFRNLSPDCVRSSAEAFCTGWETIHRLIPAIVETLHFLDQSWFLPILERENSYRTQLSNVCSRFSEEAIGSPRAEPHRT